MKGRPLGRPVEHHLIEFFKQNPKAEVTAKEAKKELGKLGYHHCGLAVRDNLLVLIERGFLIRNGHGFSMAEGWEEVDMTSPTPKIEPPIPNHSERNRCDRCGRKFELGEVPHIKKFSNIKLYLCEDCFSQKNTATSAPIAPCLF